LAYSDDQWARVRALFELGVSLSEINKEVGIDKAAVSRKAKFEGWIKSKNQPIVDKEVEARQALREVEAQKSTANPIERAAVDFAVEKRLMRLEFFDGAHILVAQVTMKKVNTLRERASFQDLNAAANTITKAREGVMGKTADVVINNTNAVQVVVAHSPAELRRLNQELEDAC
jgi:hypothetical protein